MEDVRGNLLGTLAIKAGLATREQVAECLGVQQEARTKGGTIPRLGEVMAEKGYLSHEQVQAILRGEFAEPGKRFGELCAQMRFSTSEQVVEALGEQDRLRDEGTSRRIGSIMVERGFLKPHQVPAVLSAQGYEIAECTKCRLSYNVSVSAPTSALKCARCGRDLIMVTGYEDMAEPEIAGDITEVPISAPVEEAVAVEENQAEAPAAEAALPAEPPTAAMPEAPGPEAAPPPPTTEEVAPEELRKAAPKDVGPLVFGEFRTTEKIGEDSLGILYKAEHVTTNQTVTLKVIDIAYARDKAFVGRFVEETKKASGLSHPNLKRVIAAGSDKGHLYYASEYIEGKSVRQLVRSEGRVSIRAATRIARAVGDALRYAHARGVYHGDIRPSYIVIAPDGGVKLAETGVAKNVRETVERFVQQDGVTPFYMAPELATPRCVADARSDIYELGATYFHMVTGKPPFEGNTPLQILMRMAQEEPPAANVVNPGVPFEVSKVIRKMMAPEFKERFGTMDELIQELDQIENLGTITGAAAVQVQAAPVSAAPAPAPAAPPPAAGRPTARKGVRGSGLRAARRGVRGSGLRAAARKGARGSGPRRGAQDEDEEGRQRAAPRRGGSPLAVLLFVGFLVVAAVAILFLIKKKQDMEAARRAEKPRTPTVEAKPEPGSPSGIEEPPAVGPETPPPTTPVVRPEPPPERKPPEPKPVHGRSLLGRGGEFWKEGGDKKEPPK